jgi:Protein of unknown function (DUF2848)
MSKALVFTVNGNGQSSSLPFTADRLVCCGWVGRDRAALDAHIEELAALGIPRPGRVPIYLNFSPYLLTNDNDVTVVSGASSGEVEYVLLCRGGRMWVTVGSDQTDRDVEAKSIPASKQMYAKYVAGSCWPYEDVRDHWDALILRCWITHKGSRVLYQEAPVGSIRSPAELIDGMPGEAWSNDEGVVIFSGTIATTSGLVYGDAYDIELEDPVRRVTIAGAYRVRVLPQYL